MFNIYYKNCLKLRKDFTKWIDEIGEKKSLEWPRKIQLQVVRFCCFCPKNINQSPTASVRAYVHTLRSRTHRHRLLSCAVRDRPAGGRPKDAYSEVSETLEEFEEKLEASFITSNDANAKAPSAAIAVDKLKTQFSSASATSMRTVTPDGTVKV